MSSPTPASQAGTVSAVVTNAELRRHQHPERRHRGAHRDQPASRRREAWLAPATTIPPTTRRRYSRRPDRPA